MPGYFGSIFDDDEPQSYFGGYRPGAGQLPAVQPDDSDESDPSFTGGGRNPALVQVGYKPGPQQAQSPLTAQQQAQAVTAARDAMSNPEVFAFMQALSDGEGQYNELNGGHKFVGWDYPGYANRAAGAYQIIPDTCKGLSRQLGLTDFSPDTQDIMAAHLIVQGGALPYLLNGDVEGAVGKLRGIWPSLPGGGQAHVDLNGFLDRYNRYLNTLDGAGS
jgi:hypothetical protein